MKFIKGVPDVTVISQYDNFNIKSMQYIDDQDDRVYLKCAEYVPQLKRGFTCDLLLTHTIVSNVNNETETEKETIRDLVLVYVNKTFEYDGFSQYEYIFYK